MTTGNVTRDLRSYASGSYGPVLAGFYNSEQWSGADSPKTVVPVNVWIKPRVRSYLLSTVDAQHKAAGVPKLEYTTFLEGGYYKTVWRKAPRRGRYVAHPYSKTFLEYFDPLCTMWPASGSPVITDTILHYFGPGTLSLPDPWTSNDDLALLGKLRESIVGSDFHLGNFLGESRQCLGMIGESARRIRRSLQCIAVGRKSQALVELFGSELDDKQLKAKRRAFEKAYGKALNKGVADIICDISGKRPTEVLSKSRRNGPEFTITPKNVSDHYLSIMYGWLPLLDDARGAAEMLAHHLNHPLQHVVRVSRNAGGVKRRLVVPTTPSPHRGEIISRSQIIATISEKDVAQLSGLLDPVSVAWEVLPWSFVADWFIPIGSWLQARGVASALHGSFVTTHVYKAYRRVAKPAETTGSSMRVNSPRYYYVSGNISRTVSTTLQVPKPNFKPLGKALSWVHCSNAVALLVQRFSGGKP